MEIKLRFTLKMGVLLDLEISDCVWKWGLVQNPRKWGVFQAWVRAWYAFTWWRHQMETFSTLLAIFAGNTPVSGEFPAQRPITRSFEVFFDQYKQLSKQSWGRWFEALSCPLWRHCNVIGTGRPGSWVCCLAALCDIEPAGLTTNCD